MRVTSLPITLKSGARQGTQRAKKILVEFDADRFERLAAVFGLYSREFLNSLHRAEKDYLAGRVRKIKSLKELRA